MAKRNETELTYNHRKIYNAKYNKERTKAYAIRLFMTNKEDEMISKHLEKQENKSKYLKDLIIKDMKKAR